MLALRLYKERMFRNANIVLTFSYGGFAGVLFLLPLFLQNLRGLSALQSGLTTFPLLLLIFFRSGSTMNPLIATSLNGMESNAR